MIFKDIKYLHADNQRAERNTLGKISLMPQPMHKAHLTTQKTLACKGSDFELYNSFLKKKKSACNCILLLLKEHKKTKTNNELILQTVLPEQPEPGRVSLSVP